MRGAVPILVLTAAALLAGCAGDDDPGPPGSTLERTLVDPDGDGILGRGPGEPLAERTELAPAGRVVATLATWAQLSDVHVTDEESPLRLEAIDRLGDRVTSAFRPQEALTVQVLAAAERSLNALEPDLVLVTGDLVDNAQHNEFDWALTALAGGTVRPDSGDEGYVGVQEASSADPFLYRPDLDAPRHPGLLDAAQESLDAPGLDAPWLPVASNHDLLVGGVEPADGTLAAVARGTRKLVTPSRALLDAVRSGAVRVGRVDTLLEGERAGTYRRVPADPARVPLSPGSATARLARAGGVTTEAGTLRGTRTVVPGVSVVTLDTVDRGGGASGVLRGEDVEQLEATLAAHAGDHIVVVSATPLEETAGGEAALAVLDDAPGVVAVLSGDTHRSRIRARRTAAGGYWLVRAPSLVDHPQQVRAYRLQKLDDGRVALDTWLLDHAGDRDGDGYVRLAGIARDLAFLDAQGGRPRAWAGAVEDRNARLYLPGR